MSRSSMSKNGKTNLAQMTQMMQNPQIVAKKLRTQGFKNLKSWYAFFHAPNMFAYTIVHLTFRAPQIFVHARI